MEELTDVLSQQGLSASSQGLGILVNQVMVEKQAMDLQPDAYQRGTNRTVHGNGYKPKTVKMRFGAITFAVPQVRLPLGVGEKPAQRACAAHKLGRDVYPKDFHMQGEGDHRVIMWFRGFERGFQLGN